MTERWRLPLLWGAVFIVVGCDQPPSEEELEIELKTGKVVTSGDPVTKTTDPDIGSETATLISRNSATGLTKKIVAFNSEHHGLAGMPGCTFPDGNTRTCCPGTSLMGWGVADVGIGATFARKRVTIDPGFGFPFIWSDPALATIPGSQFVYMTQLTTPLAKIGAGCHTGSFGGLTSGACIARSTDNGINFTLGPTDCFAHPNGNLYDGTSLVALPNGNVYAAYLDMDLHKIDVWRAPNATAAFTRISDPIPSLAGLIDGHPRMTTDGNNVFLMARQGSNLWIQCINGASRCTIPSLSSWPMIVATDFAMPDINVNGKVIRRAAQYEMTINNANLLFGQHVEVLYAVFANGRAILKEKACRVFGTPRQCDQKGTVDPGVPVWNPAIGTSDIQRAGQPEAVRFQAAWSQQSGTQVVIFSGLLKGPSGSQTNIGGFVETGSSPVCGYTPTPYWGDYNTGLGLDQATPALDPRFWTSFSDSTSATCVQGAVRSFPLEVSTTFIPIR